MSWLFSFFLLVSIIWPCRSCVRLPLTWLVWFNCLFRVVLALETEGLFRRSAQVSVVREVQSRINRGEIVDFHREFPGDYHLAAVALKTFLRELKEPLMTFELFDEIVQFQRKFRLRCGPIDLTFIEP